jgi:cell division protein FtsI/penicillin-binding protein 2
MAFTRSPTFRMLVVAIPMLVVMAGLGGRLYYLQVISHPELSQTVKKMHERLVRLPALRGMILDCNENILANSVTVRTVIVDPKFIRDEDQKRLKAKKPAQAPELVSILSEQLALPRSEVAKKLAETKRYVVLKKKVPEETVQNLQSILKREKLRGVIFEDDQIRVYPNGPLMSHVLGYVNSEQKGMDGVELLMGNELQGQDGWRKGDVDRRGREIPVFRSEDFPARNGCKVVLTLDQAIQNIVEQELQVAVQKYRPEGATVIVMRPETGEILALANRPTFDPNSPDKQIETLKNLAVTDLIEPGSTFKIAPIASALDHRIISLDDTIYCENGRFLYAGRYLHDHKPHGNLTVVGVMVESSNIGAAKIALMLGKERFYHTIINFGFGERAFGDGNEGWPGEVRGIVHPIKDWTKLSITRLAMGHEVSVTPIQMVTAMCAIANGGNLMKPMIVKKVVDFDGNVVRENFAQVRRRVVDHKAAALTTQALTQVVTKEGTALKAAIPGFKVAGKTGTAQKIVDGKYSNDKVVSSFCGYFPAEKPEVCIYVMLDDPKAKEHTGGAVAAPIFKEMGVRIASYLNLKPTLETTLAESSKWSATGNQGRMP